SAPTEAGTLLTLTAQGVPVGTPLYMAPEQIKGDGVDGRADQFAWGVVAYEALTGRLPWDNRSDALALAPAILTQRPPRTRSLNPDAPGGGEGSVPRALSKSPGDGFASMGQVLAALEPLVVPTSGGAPPTVRTTSKPPVAPASAPPPRPAPPAA